jgi:hypothetical protein
MVAGLRSLKVVEITKARIARPATPAQIAAASAGLGRPIPEEILGFYREMNGFELAWDHRDGDDVHGRVCLLPIQKIFVDLKGVIWFDEDDPFRDVAPFDEFVPEACAAFQRSEDPLRVHYHYRGEELEPTGYDFGAYLERLLESRGYRYWILTLTRETAKSRVAKAFFEDAPKLFPDLDLELFRPGTTKVRPDTTKPPRQKAPPPADEVSRTSTTALVDGGDEALTQRQKEIVLRYASDSDLAAEREAAAEAAQRLSDFLTATKLDADLVKAAADLAAERAQRAEADQKAAADLNSNLAAALDAANSRIFALESANRQAAVDNEAAAEDALRFWTADQSVRVFMSPIVPGGGNHSCIVPRRDGSAKMRLRFFVINASPFEVKVTSIKFNFSAVMEAFQLSGEYNGPPGENADSVVRLAPWRQHHFFVRVKGSLANVAKISNKYTRIVYLYLHDNCYVTVRGHWDTPQRAPLLSNAGYMLVSWGEFG